MRIAYLDCFAGIAGDMFLGALLDAGVPLEVLQGAAAALNINASLKIEKVDRSGVSATKVHVLEGGHLAEQIYTRQPDQQHQHKTGHAHDHGHTHTPDDHSPNHGHGRSLTAIRTLIQSAPLADP